MTYSLDFRHKVLQVKESESLSLQETANRFCIGIASVARWEKRIEARQAGCPRRRKIDKAALLADVEKHPDAYQYERAKRFGVCQGSICQGLKKLGVTYKKNTTPSQSGRKGTTELPTKD